MHKQFHLCLLTAVASDKISRAVETACNCYTACCWLQSVTPHGFRVGMKLEAVDKKNNTETTCVATVIDVLGDRVLVHFDGWDNIYDYWSDPSSPFLHPVGWCQENGKPLSPPNGLLAFWLFLTCLCRFYVISKLLIFFSFCCFLIQHIGDILLCTLNILN